MTTATKQNELTTETQGRTSSPLSGPGSVVFLREHEMTLDEIRDCEHGTLFAGFSRNYRLHIYNHNKHDLWFWGCYKDKRICSTIIPGPRSKVVRVYLGHVRRSGRKKLEAQNVAFLATLTKIA